MNKEQYVLLKVELLELQVAALINYNNALSDALASTLVKMDEVYREREKDWARESVLPLINVRDAWQSFTKQEWDRAVAQEWDRAVAHDATTATTERKSAFSGKEG